MSDLVRITQGLYIGSALDSDGYLEVSVGADDEFSYGWMSPREVLALLAHLQKLAHPQKLLEDADKEQEMER